MKLPVHRDPIDIRDLIYRPALALLPQEFLCAALRPKATAKLAKPLERRRQGMHGTCIGQALASVIDIQRIEAAISRHDDIALGYVEPASADMLYVMALAAQGSGTAGGGEEIRSLRSGLKGFYNSGVCTAERWGKRSRGGKFSFDLADVEVMREARNVTLGAYYRVMPVINDYHAALAEAGALYVAAEIHGGWDKANLREGAIAPPSMPGNAGGGHAFVIVGYNQQGFYVLNSWGEDWSSVASPFPKEPPLKGVALWPYEDWAGSVLDAWVLRLAVSTPNAFRYTIGEHGLASFAGQTERPIASSGARRLDLAGRYAHLDDGRHVQTGTLPSSRRSFATSLRHLARPAAEQGALEKHAYILLVIHGDILPTGEVLARSAREFDKDKAMTTADGTGSASIYRFSIAWANDLLSGANDALAPLFEAAHQRSKGNARDADRRIEEMTRPVGKALWRDVKRAARIAGGKAGDARDILAGFVSHCHAHGKNLHVLAEGAGIQLLSPLLARPPDRLADVLESLAFVAPLMARREFAEDILPFLEHWGQRGRTATIYSPDAAFDRRLGVGLYSGSWRQLVAQAFEERIERMLTDPTNISGPPEAQPAHWPIEVLLKAPDEPAGRLSLEALFRHPELDRAIRATILAAAPAGPRR